MTLIICYLVAVNFPKPTPAPFWHFSRSGHHGSCRGSNPLPRQFLRCYITLPCITLHCQFSSFVKQHTGYLFYTHTLSFSLSRLSLSLSSPIDLSWQLYKEACFQSLLIYGDWNLDDDESKSAKSQSLDGTDDGEMDVYGLSLKNR